MLIKVFCGRGAFVSVSASCQDVKTSTGSNLNVAGKKRFISQAEQKLTCQGEGWVRLILLRTWPAVGGCDIEGYP
jgi:hypothetical protein